MEKQIIITITEAGELRLEKRGITDTLQVVGLLEMVKAGEITAAIRPAPVEPPKSNLKLHKP